MRRGTERARPAAGGPALAMAVAGLAGCAAWNQPEPRFATESGRESLGRIAYVTANYEPERRALFLKRNKWQGAGLGIGGGVMDCLYVSAMAGPVGEVVGVLLSPVCGLVGGVAGASTAASADAVEAADAAIQDRLARLGPNAGLRAALAAHVAAHGLPLRELPPALGPAEPAARPTYERVERSMADTVLEIAVVQFDACSNGDENLATGLQVSTRLRLVAPAPAAGAGQVLDEVEFDYFAEPVPLSEPASDGAEVFDRQLAEAHRSIIELAVARWPRIMAAGAPPPAAGGDAAAGASDNRPAPTARSRNWCAFGRPARHLIEVGLTG